MKRIESVGRIVGVLCIGGIAFAFAKFQGGFVSWFIFYMILPFITYSIALYLYPLRDFTVDRQVNSNQVMNNGKVLVQLTVKRKWPFPLLYTMITDYRQFSIKQRTSQRMVLVGFRREYSFAYTLTNIPRGEHILSHAEIEVVDFFNWIRKSRSFPVRDVFLVYPKLTELVYESSASGMSEGRKLSSYIQAKDATMPSSVREYTTGDRLSWIHWKSFARTNKLMTKEFDDQQSQQYMLLLDCEPSNTFEVVVEFAASFLVTARQHQAGLTLLLADQQSFAIRSADQMEQALVHLAKIQPHQTINLSLPEGSIDKEDSLFVITGYLRMEFIKRVLEEYRRPSAITCFVAVDERSLTEDFNQKVKQAREMGINIRLISRNDLSAALKKAVT
ncbi:DUF58 domain-containing protein [Sporosarcina sp. PTS2304]|uniref:DUF58 domain-containing protein n=1 Tax=Sporosarcina sp. PTS2304 TaxID=2283194 RepID=UPI000E0D1439|nr:DUF58 domain-containing protein [Sporosarcina sp. PTS2304]AXI00078.1 DUF58 domain-containing protein [Sporosarcina sp. PTS2304]